MPGELGKGPVLDFGEMVWAGGGGSIYRARAAVPGPALSCGRSRREGDSGRAWEAPPSLWVLAVKQWGFAKSSLGPGLRSHRILGFWGFGWWLQGPVISSGLRARIPE